MQDPNQLIESSTKSRQFHQVTALTLFHILFSKALKLLFFINSTDSSLSPSLALSLGIPKPPELRRYELLF